MNDSLRHLLQAGIGIWLQSTWLLLLGLAFGKLVHKHGALAASAAYRGTLVSVVVSAVIGAVFAGHIRPLVSIDVPSTPAVVTIPAPRSMTHAMPIVGHAAASPSSSTTRPMSTEALGVHAHGETVRYSARLPVYGIVVGIWALAAAVQLLWLMVCHLWMWRLRRSATLLTSGAVVDALKDLANRLHVREPALLTSPTVRSPFVAGIVHPSIYLPTHFADELPDVEMRAILSHELAHVRQNDCLWNVVFRTISAVLWPQPLIWILRRRWQEATEQVCDQWVLSFDCPPSVYADCLLRLAAGLSMPSSRSSAPWLPGRGLRPDRVAGVGVFSFKSLLGRRIQAILARTQIRLLSLSRSARTAVALGTLAAAIATVFLVSTPARSMVRKQIHRLAVVNVVAEKPQTGHPAIKGSTAHMKKTHAHSLLPALLALAGGAVQVNLPADAAPATSAVPQPAASRPAQPVAKVVVPVAKGFAMVAQGDAHLQPAAPSGRPVMVSAPPSADTIHVDIGPDGQPLPLSVDFENVPIKQALKQFFDACHVNYAIDEDVQGSVNVSMNNVGMLAGLRSLLGAAAPSRLTYDFTDGVYRVHVKLVATVPGSPDADAQAIVNDAQNALVLAKNQYAAGLLDQQQLNAAQTAYDVAKQQADLRQSTSSDERDYKIPVENLVASTVLDKVLATGVLKATQNVPEGKATVIEGQNSISLHCTPAQFAGIREFIRGIDIAPSQVWFAMKVVNTSAKELARLGVDASELSGGGTDDDKKKLTDAMAHGRLKVAFGPSVTTVSGVPATISFRNNGRVQTGTTVSITPVVTANNIVSTTLEYGETKLMDGAKDNSTQTNNLRAYHEFSSGETSLIATVQEGKDDIRLVFATAKLRANTDPPEPANGPQSVPAQ